jgi:hypothetical protein
MLHERGMLTFLQSHARVGHAKRIANTMDAFGSHYILLSQQELRRRVPAYVNSPRTPVETIATRAARPGRIQTACRFDVRGGRALSCVALVTLAVAPGANLPRSAATRATNAGGVTAPGKRVHWIAKICRVPSRPFLACRRWRPESGTPSSRPCLGSDLSRGRTHAGNNSRHGLPYWRK